MAYNLWHRRAYRVARRLHQHVGFDLVHQATFCGYREPGYLWKLGVPFVWGPLGGTQNCPWRFLPAIGIRGGVQEGLRTALNVLQLRMSRRVRRAARGARALFAANSTVARDLARVHGIRPLVCLENGLSAAFARSTARGARPGALRILWSGEFRPFKGLSLLIEALAGLPPDVAYELRVLGAGPERRRWQRLARRAGIASRTTWPGWLPHGEVWAQYEWADLFAFTSLRDTTGTVVLEALGAGVPVVCLDHQGVHDVVTDQCGIRIPVTTPRQVVRRLRDAIVRLARDEPWRQRLSLGAAQRAQTYLWSRQIAHTAAVYQGIAGPMPSSPGRRVDEVA